MFCKLAQSYLFTFSCLLAALLTVSPGSFADSSQERLIKIDGSSTVYPITEAVAEEFKAIDKSNTKITVGISGTGGGFKKFCRGETDVANASRPISTSEIKDCTAAKVSFYEIPIAYDAIVLVVNKTNTWVSEIKISELKKIWEPEAEGKIKTWNQVNPKWPNQPIKLYGAGPDSGTFDYFTEAVNQKPKASRGDFTSSEDDNTTIQGVKTDKMALGFVPYAYYQENSADLKALAIINDSPASDPQKASAGDSKLKAEKKGATSRLGLSAVFPTAETVKDGSYAPLARPIFIYINAAAQQRPEVQEFVAFFLKKSQEPDAPVATKPSTSTSSPTELALLKRCPGPSVENISLVCQVRYVPLPNAAYKMAQARLDKKVIGSVFGGHAHFGLKIDDLLKMETQKK